MAATKEQVEYLIDEAVMDVMWNCNMPDGAVRQAIEEGTITVDEMVNIFKESVKRKLA